MKSGVRQPDPEELQVINSRFARRELTAEELYVFQTSAADNKTVTAYFSRLGEDMIRAFHRDVQARHSDSKAPIVGYLFGHNDAMIPSGTLFQSELAEEDLGDGTKAVHFKPSVFMLKDLNVGGINTDDYIRAHEAGHTEDVSVGFMASSYICDLCGQDIRNFFACEHVPGRYYNMTPDAETPTMKQATYTVHQGWFKDHNLLELSGVYRGAMFGSRIEPGQQQYSGNENGIGGYWVIDKDSKEAKQTGQRMFSRNIKDFKPGDVLRFNHNGDGMIELMGRVEMKENENGEANYDVLIKDLEAKLKAEHDAHAALKAELEKTVEELTKIREEHKAVVKTLGMSEVDKVDLGEKLAAANQKIAELEAKLAETQKVIDAYVTSLKEECRKMSVRVLGQNHKDDIFDKEVEALSIEDLKLKIQAYEKQASQMFPAGRHSGATSPDKTGQAATEARPELYKVQ